MQAHGSYTQSTKGDALTFEADGDLVLKVPEGAALHVASVHGDAVLKSLRGACELGEVQGDVVLSNMGSVTLAEVHGDLVARNLSGPVAVQLVLGDAVLRAVDGAAVLGTVQGDLTAAYINGALAAEAVYGDVNVAAISGDVTIGDGRRDLNARELGGMLQAKDIAAISGCAAGCVRVTMCWRRRAISSCAGQQERPSASASSRPRCRITCRCRTWKKARKGSVAISATAGRTWRCTRRARPC